ncbi:MAG: radical SAM/SPASM domain-containing protein, partial [Candidatus Lokiarchaeia archaeon]
MEPSQYTDDGALWLEKGIPLDFDLEKLAEWIEKKGPVSYLMFGITYQCQCNCRHCCTGNYIKEKHRNLTTDEVKDVLDQANKAMVVNFFGGEPTLRPDLMELINYASDRAVFVFVDTNGIRVTKDYAQQLKDSGLDLLYVSIDSPHATEHDDYRRFKGCFEKAVGAVKNALDVGLHCVLSTYITKENLSNGDFERVIQMAKDLGATGVRYLLPTPAGRWLHNVDVMLSPKEVERVREIVDFPFVCRDFYFQNQKSSRCRGVADKEYIYVSPYGDVQPCCFMPLSFGNVREEPFKVILERMWSHPMYSEPCL